MRSVSVSQRVMGWLSPGGRPPVSRSKRWVAIAIAAGADALQIGLFPFFAEGIASPLDAGLDVGVALVITALLGWHVAFLPGFLLEAVPLVNLAPTWTIATMIALRGRRGKHSEPETGL